MKMKTVLPIFYLPPVSWFAEFLKDENEILLDRCKGVGALTAEQAIAYSAIVECAGRTYCFYNGNDFGGSGFGCAERINA